MSGIPALIARTSRSTQLAHTAGPSTREQWIVAALVVVPFLLVIAWWVLVVVVNGFRAMFEWVVQFGPMGIAAMVVLVVFAFPVALTVAIVLGLLVEVGKRV